MANLLFKTSQALFKQLEVLQKCNDSDLESELKRADGMSKVANPIAATAKAEAAIYIATGTLPENNVLFASDEKILTNAQLEKKGKVLKSSLAIEEFTRGTVKQ